MEVRSPLHSIDEASDVFRQPSLPRVLELNDDAAARLPRRRADLLMLMSWFARRTYRVDVEADVELPRFLKRQRRF